MSCAKTAEPIDAVLGADSCGSKEPCTSWGSDRFTGSGNSGDYPVQ